MPRRNSKSNSKGRKDNYAEFTNRFVEALEAIKAGTVDRLPWERPWDATCGLPQNGISKRTYSGVNPFLLWMTGFSDHRWYTFNQTMTRCGFVRSGRWWKYTGKGDEPTGIIPKGTKGTKVYFWLFRCRECGGTKINNGTCGKCGELFHGHPSMKVYTVFNHEQIEWPEGREPELPEGNDIDPDATHANVMAMLKATGAKVSHGGARAYYKPSTDSIRLPAKGSFKAVEGYLSTRIHETVHWTGHSTRCNRDLEGRFGTEAYAMEELVAEMATAFMAMDLGLTTVERADNHLAYLEDWIKVLRDDKYAVFTAARLAKEAARFIVGEVADATEQEAA